MIAVFVVSFAFVFLMAGRFDAEALATAVVLAGLGCGWSLLLRVAGSRSVARPGRGAWAAWGNALRSLPADTARIGAALVRALGGKEAHWVAVEAPFRFGPEDDPAEAGRRAVALIAGSLTPDRIVVDMAPGRATASTHRLADGEPGDPEWLA